MATTIIRKDDFTKEALDLGLWESLTKDYGVPADAEEIEIQPNWVRKVA